MSPIVRPDTSPTAAATTTRARSSLRRRGGMLGATLLIGAVLPGCGSDDQPDAAAETTADTSSAAASPSTGEGERPGSTAAGADGPAADPAAEVAGIGSFAVGSLEVDVVDDSRPTDAWGGQEELPQRTLPTLVLYPAEGEVVTADGSDVATPEATPDATPAEGPWPLVVFSHGRGGTGPAYVNTLRAWASAGYVVLAPTFPLTSAETPERPNTDDLVNQPADVSHLIDWASDLPADSPLAGRIDAERVGLSGHSLGGFTSLAAAYNPKLRDDRVDAVAEWAGAYRGELADGGAPVQDGPPLLAIHGDGDDTVPYEAAQNTVDAVGPPWELVTLVGGEHIPPYVTGMADPYGAVVTETTLDFFDATLKDDPEGDDRLEAVVEEAGASVATLTGEED
ncbi:MAG: dienelactone hydrolase family protein [Microthrixaceae bacterium]